MRYAYIHLRQHLLSRFLSRVVIADGPHETMIHSLQKDPIEPLATPLRTLALLAYTLVAYTAASDCKHE